MKTFKFIGMAVLAIMLSFNLVACSDDDGKSGGGNALAGTTWEVVSSEMLFEEGHVLTFKADGTFITNDVDWEDKGNGRYYLLGGNFLIMYLNDDWHCFGYINIDGNTADYNCAFSDIDGRYNPQYDYKKDWETDNYKGIVKLQKQKYNEKPAWLKNEWYYDRYSD